MKTTELLLDMKESHKTILLDILDRFVPAGLEVWAFGSRARWTARETSDLDLVLRNPAQLETRLEAGLLDTLKEAFEESDLPFMVDLLDWATVSEKFRKVIEREFVVVRKGGRVGVREGWKSTTWGEIASLEYGKSLKDYQNSSGDVPVFGTNGPIGFTDKPLCNFPSVIIGRKGAYRGVHYSNKPFFVIDTAFYLKPMIDDLDLLFAYYQLLTQDINTMDSGSAIPSTSREDFYNLEINLPPLTTQRRIAAILSALDEKIELNRQTNQTLEAIAQALFKEWFVDFNYLSEPRLEGLKDCLDYDSSSMKSDSSFNQVNHGSDGKLSDICELNPKLLLKKGTVAPYVEMKDLSSDSATIKRSIKREFTSGSKFQNGDTLLARITPCLENGKTGLVNFLKDEEVGWGSTEFIVMRAKGYVSPYFVYCLARQQCFRDFAIQSMVGSSGRQRVVESILSDFDVAIPDETVMKCFHATVAPIFQQLHENKQQAATLTAIRDTLLPKLMGGEINV